jgi:hypothetical protein
LGNYVTAKREEKLESLDAKPEFAHLLSILTR